MENKRTRDVIARRFGLESGEKETLEEIGQDYKITRERVRQIEESGLKALAEPRILSYLEPHFDYISGHLREYGDLRREETLLSNLAFVCFPVANLDNISPKDDSLKDFSLCQSALSLILVLGDSFVREKESQKFHPLWTVNRKSLALAKKIVDFFAKHFQRASKTLEFKQLLNQVKEIDRNISDKALESYLDASKEINANKFGFYGLSHWPEISPKGVRDKAYLILKQHCQPLHFVKITELINEHRLDGKRAQVETVHNELIKDPRFVLIGRGIYALSDWGYKPGTVLEIIAELLEQHGSLTKDEIIENVSKQRLIKENTVMINLQNRKFFVRGDDGKYGLR